MQIREVMEARLVERISMLRPALTLYTRRKVLFEVLTAGLQSPRASA